MSFYRIAWRTGQNVSHHSLKIISSTAALKSYIMVLWDAGKYGIWKRAARTVYTFSLFVFHRRKLYSFNKGKTIWITQCVFCKFKKRCLLCQDGISRLILISGRTLSLEKYKHQIFGNKQEADLLHRWKNQGKQHSKNEGL